jgi:hypothetical protein
MWVQIGAAAGAIVLAVAMFRRFKRKPRGIDVGAVSEAWLAEHRARGRDSAS